MTVRGASTGSTSNGGTSSTPPIVTVRGASIGSTSNGGTSSTETPPPVVFEFRELQPPESETGSEAEVEGGSIHSVDDDVIYMESGGVAGLTAAAETIDPCAQSCAAGESVSDSCVGPGKLGSEDSQLQGGADGVGSSLDVVKCRRGGDDAWTLPATSSVSVKADSCKVVPLYSDHDAASVSTSMMQYADHQMHWPQNGAEHFDAYTSDTTSCTIFRADHSYNRRSDKQQQQEQQEQQEERLQDDSANSNAANIKNACCPEQARGTGPVLKMSSSELETVEGQTTPDRAWESVPAVASSVQYQQGEELVHSHAYHPYDSVAASGATEPIAVHSSLLQALPKVRSTGTCLQPLITRLRKDNPGLTLYSFYNTFHIDIKGVGVLTPAVISSTQPFLQVRNIFAVVCDISVSGKRVYPWGSLDVNNEEHSDFRRLQRLVFEDSHIVQLREATQALSMRRLQQTAFKARMSRSGRAHGRLVQAMALLRGWMKLLSNVFALLGWVALVVVLLGYAASGADSGIFSSYCSRCVSVALQLSRSEQEPPSQQATGTDAAAHIQTHESFNEEHGLF